MCFEAEKSNNPVYIVCFFCSFTLMVTFLKKKKKILSAQKYSEITSMQFVHNEAISATMTQFPCESSCSMVALPNQKRYDWTRGTKGRRLSMFPLVNLKMPYSCLSILMPFCTKDMVGMTRSQLLFRIQSLFCLQLAYRWGRWSKGAAYPLWKGRVIEHGQDQSIKPSKF